MESRVLKNLLEDNQVARVRHGKVRRYKSGDDMLISKGFTAIKISVARAYFSKNNFNRAISQLDKLLAKKPIKGGVE